MENLKTKLGIIVIQDNAGGLTLFVKRDKQVIWAHSGYEYCRGRLIEDLRALWAGRDPIEEGWDNGEDDPQGMFDELIEDVSCYWAWETVATDTGIAPDRWRYSAWDGRGGKGIYYEYIG